MLWYSTSVLLGLGGVAGGLYGLLATPEEGRPEETDSARSERSFRERDSLRAQHPPGEPVASDCSSPVGELLSKLKTLTPLESRNTADRIGELFCKAVASLELVSTEQGQHFTAPQKLKILHKASSFMNLVRMHMDKLQQGAHLHVRRQNTQEEYRMYKTALRSEIAIVTEVVDDLQGKCLNFIT